MAVKIRLARHGAKKAPYYRIVVADSRVIAMVAILSRLAPIILLPLLQR